MTAVARLLRIEFRRSAMLWLLPPIAAVFWFVVYRRAVAEPPLWNLRATGAQTAAVSVFVPIVVGAGAWTGSREGRHGLLDLLAGTARPRWTRQAAAWAATTGWAVAAYLACVGVLYAVTARQGAWGGPLWWPVAVGVASMPAFTALGFAAGALRPSRFTAPLIAVAAFFALELTAQLIHGATSAWQVSPLVAGPWNLGGDAGIATFYRYLPDLPLAQIMFLAGLTAALLGALGLPAGSGGRPLRRCAAAVTVAGLVLAGTAVALAGTARLDAHGMVAISALHDPADDRPVAYTPRCAGAPIPICVHPAYAAYLPVVSAALEPLLAEIAGLPGAPIRVAQTAAAYREEPANGVEIRPEPGGANEPTAVLRLLLPVQLPGPRLTDAELAARVRADTGRDIVAGVIGGDRDHTSAAQRAVIDAILGTFDADTDTDVTAAAHRFAALPPSTRHAWLLENLTALRSGVITPDQLP